MLELEVPMRRTWLSGLAAWRGLAAKPSMAACAAVVAAAISLDGAHLNAATRVETQKTRRKASSTAGTDDAAPKETAPKETAKPQAWPDFSTVTDVVESNLKAKRQYRPGDLISRGDFQPILKELAELGWKVDDRDEIEHQLLPDDDYLVRELRTNDGRAFMRQVAQYPGGYDRLDRLVDLSDGRVILRRLINGPDGYKLLEYLTTAPGGREMGKMLSQAPHGKNFNQSTHRIYTADQLLDRLKSSHAREAASRGGGAEAKRGGGAGKKGTGYREQPAKDKKQ
jgi:hypothetical protein